MPVYHARSIAVHLGSMPLAETTTSDVVMKKGEVAKRQSEAAEKSLLQSGYLSEKRVSFPGDGGGFELNWLGNAPFMQVQVDPGFAQSSGLSPSARQPGIEQNISQALTLHVKLTEKSFLSGFNGKTHLKIEVFFNGLLSNCSLIHTNDIRSGAKSLHQVFAGYRVDYLAERPWVLLPPFMTANGGTRRFRKTVTPMERWEEVRAAILKESDKRGTDKHGEPSQSAAFLQALAGMEMPDCVKIMQKPGGRRFGVVDVVITAGFGSKIITGTSYLKRPQRLEDSNYAVRTKSKSGEEAAVVESGPAQDPTVRLLEEASPGGTQIVADAGESCVLEEHPRKRQSLSSADELSQHSQTHKPFQSPFLSGQIPVLPPPVRHSFEDSLSTTWGIVSPRCPSPEHRNDGHKQPLPMDDHNRSYSIACEINGYQHARSDACLSFYGYRSPPLDSDIHTVQAYTVNPALYNLTLPEHAISHGSIGGPPSVGSPSVSSPVSQTFGYQKTPRSRRMYSDQTGAMPYTTHLGPPAVSVPPAALMLSTPPNWSVPPSDLDPPYHQPKDFQRQSQPGISSSPPTYTPYMRPNGLPTMLSETPPLYGHSDLGHFTTGVVSTPPFLHPCRALPPTAMFSVPSKPRCSSPDKTAAKNNHAYRTSVLVSRLIITGRHGKPIIDHIWKLPQRIFVSTMKRGRVLTADPAKTAALEDDQTDRYRSLRTKSSQAEDTPQRTDQERRDSVTGPAIEVPLPYLKKHQGPTDKTIQDSSRIDVPDKIAPFVPPHMLAAATSTLTLTPVLKPGTASATQSTVLQRRSFPRSSKSSIQGPKAATFLFDDPEEVLREAARMRRSRSPTKPAATPPALPVTSVACFEPATDREVREDSSPLSSAPSSPLRERPVDVATTADTAPDRIPQLDGSPQRKPASIPLRKLQTPSPTKVSLTAPSFQRPDPVIPPPSTSPTSRKRKASHQSPTRLPRSPGRLKTVDNPLLNNDCVIAFAESVEKTDVKGVLRQVKGERQGEFREEYVVLAVRFFIAGE